MNFTAVFPGSFDPFTNGHLDIIERALGLFDELVVAVAEHTSKNCLFNIEERKELIVEGCKYLGTRVAVLPFNGLLVDFMKNQGINTIVRGLRAVADYEYEVQMSQMNRHLGQTLKYPIDTVFLPAGDRASYISSSIIKQVASLGGNVSGLVPSKVVVALATKFNL
jgi:pantetheine-phosphate adenylyltransferase